jgi:hypothetical protein
LLVHVCNFGKLSKDDLEKLLQAIKSKDEGLKKKQKNRQAKLREVIEGCELV